jgi:hypothetical protein
MREVGRFLSVRELQQKIARLDRPEVIEPPARKVTLGGVIRRVLVAAPFALGLLWLWGLSYEYTPTANSTVESAAKPQAVLDKPVAPSCKVDNWRYRIDSIGNIIIEGKSTCPTGKITIRALDSKDKWLGNGSDYIDAFAFKVYIRDVAVPGVMKINYVIE